MSFQFEGIDHVQLTAPAGSEDEARRFYIDLLGLKETPKPVNLRGNGGCWFLCGNQEIHIGREEPYTPPRKAHPAFVVKNLEQLRIRLTEENITIQEEQPIEGRTRFFVRDPFGNKLEFLEYHV
ncbi:glyoxalase [Jeotgalibacillus alimentarius]|uniref:Glyoxalase n=1 Tax=Jeotgalibacillus alimentarius TaxID=135826 RepID=A0A0C2VFT2_9BACL|nr:VOC family protein [Jeotgalibacillus alimentarius]KIL43381.1 glyoxalase [Jeotgalibacillus alimentarius]